ncbi:hypothetical protein H7X65_03075, partial [Candidatus Parcubacteria bacterium]|nr:hypothetical protein [Candidatus Parcubacteria bacterium]
MRPSKPPLEKMLGWVIAIASIPPNGGVNFTFNRAQSDELFPGLVGTTVHFHSIMYREAHILPAEGKHRDRLVTFQALGVGLTIEDGYEYAMLICVNSYKVIEIKSISLKVGFDSA